MVAAIVFGNATPCSGICFYLFQHNETNGITAGPIGFARSWTYLDMGDIETLACVDEGDTTAPALQNPCQQVVVVSLFLGTWQAIGILR